MRILFADPVPDDSDDDLVGHQATGIHDFLGLQADRRLRGNGCPKHVARRELGNAIFGDQARCLCSLPRPRRSDQYEPHRRLPLSFAFFTRPSY